MATPPTFTAGSVLTAAQMNAVGLWLVKSQTIGTGVSSVPVTNAFSADYDNYRIIVSGGLSSSNGNMNFQLSNSTGSTYSTSGWFMTPGTATLNAFSPAATTSWLMGPVNSTRYMGIMDIINPFQSQQTFARTSGAGTVSAYDFVLSDTSTASSTGFSLIPSSPITLTGGTIRVYGYRN
jgi:hypothetical protein